MSTVSSFVKEVIARMTGDQNQVIAAQNERKANAAMTSNISQIESSIVDQEEKVNEAEEGLNAALYPTEKITDNAAYLRAISRAEDTLTVEKETLEELRQSLKTWEARKRNIFKPVAA